MTEEPLMTALEVAAWLATSDQFVYDAVRDLGLPAIRFGRTYRFRRGDVQAWIESRVA